MIKNSLLAAAALAGLSCPASAQEEPQGAPSPGEIVAAAPASDWLAIPAEDVLVMTLAPAADGSDRTVVIQLMPAPFSQGWVSNIRLFARSGWYDGISVNRVQDNYVVQWGDPNYDNPEATGETKPLPEGLKVMGEDEYVVSPFTPTIQMKLGKQFDTHLQNRLEGTGNYNDLEVSMISDPYARQNMHVSGWPVALDHTNKSAAPTHCYGMVGVGRNYSPDTGSGAELYTVIGHAPRHLDRNIALVGRVIEGMEHLSSLPRGKGELGFYADFEKDKRTPIRQVRIASDLHETPQPAFEYLSTESESFAKYAEARANRRDPFFIVSAGGADICNIPVPIRRVAG